MMHSEERRKRASHLAKTARSTLTTLVINDMLLHDEDPTDESLWKTRISDTEYMLLQLLGVSESDAAKLIAVRNR